MAEMTLTQQILRLRNIGWKFALYETPIADPAEEHIRSELKITRSDFEALGEPMEVTIRIEPGVTIE